MEYFDTYMVGHLLYAQRGTLDTLQERETRTEYPK